MFVFSALPRIAALVLLTIATTAISSHAEATKSLRVVFWNMEWFPGGSPTATSADVVAQIVKAVPAVAKLGPDIFCAEEILNAQAMEISLYKSPGLTPQVCSAFLDEAGEETMQQIAIASKSPALGSWWESWKPGAVTPKRGFSVAVFEPVPGNILLVYAVHFKSNRGKLVENIAMREESARQLLAHVGEMEKAYASLGKVSVVIGGDFNTSREDPKFREEETLEMFRKAGYKWAWEGVSFKDRISLPASPPHDPKLPPFPAACFDHVFAKGVKVSAARVAALPDNPSDHRPVEVELEFPVPLAPATH
jgi:endonuclease/exonuclease/phosphatase family metal-dependent hydrolase